MALLEHSLRFVQSAHPAFFVAVVPAIVILVHFIPWLVDPHGLRSYPGPWIAHFSDLWLGRVAQQGHRSEVVHRMHEKYGEYDRHVPPLPRPQANILLP
jgi:benzoate 4-monooxygenase